MKQKKEVYIFALGAQGKGISGGDRIFIELARRWSKSIPIRIILDQEGFEMCKRQNLKENQNLTFAILPISYPKIFGFFHNYIARIIVGIKLGLTLNPISIGKNTKIYIYNASEFWMDSIPCLLLKIRYPDSEWIATWYQTAPNPLKGFVEKRKDSDQRKKKYFFSAMVYWLMQLPIKPFIHRFADKVIVNNEDEKRRFPNHTGRGKTIVLIGAVPLEHIKKWKKKHKILLKQYDAVFQGRFHPQKGVVELIEIWKEVVNKIPDAQLCLIGDGPLMKDVKSTIQDYHLEKNVTLFGYVFDGDEKFKIFAQSKIVVHPAFYDSGGMATAEAMAFGIPAVGFDLKAYESYYPKGFIAVENSQEFAHTLVKLIMDSKTRKRIGNEAYKLIESQYSWDRRAMEIYDQAIKN